MAKDGDEWQRDEILMIFRFVDKTSVKHVVFD